MWQNVINPDGSPRDLNDAGVVELTGLPRESVHHDGRTVDQLKTWPKDMRVIVRRERPHPGAQLSLFEDADGWRYQVFATNTPATLRGTLGQLVEPAPTQAITGTTRTPRTTRTGGEDPQHRSHKPAHRSR